LAEPASGVTEKTVEEDQGRPPSGSTVADGKIADLYVG